MNYNPVLGIQVTLSIIALVGITGIVYLICKLFSLAAKSFSKIDACTTDPDPFPPVTLYPPMPSVKPPKPEPVVVELLEQNGRGLFIFKGNKCT